MDKNYMHELVDALNATDCNVNNGTYIATCISTVFNCYDDYDSLASQIHGELTKLGKKKFFTCISLAMIELAHTWCVNNGEYWDKRKSAVMSFASGNISYFEKLFREQNGYKLEFDSSRDTYFPSCITSHDVQKDYFHGFLLSWMNIHPTTQRSFLCGVLNGIFVKEYRTTFSGSRENGRVVFPFF